MSSKDTLDIARALLGKGFRQRQGDHKRYFLYVDGRKTSIWTKLSHSVKQYGPNLLAKIQKQLRFQGDRQRFNDLLDCPMSYEEYVAYLRERGHIRG